MIRTEFGVPFVTDRTREQESIIEIIVDASQESDRLFFVFIGFHAQTSVGLVVVAGSQVVVQESVCREVHVFGIELFPVEFLIGVTAHYFQVVPIYIQRIIA